MLKPRINVGSYVRYGDITHRVDAVRAEEIHLRGLGEPITYNEFWDLALCGAITLLGENFQAEREKIELLQAVDFDAQPERDRKTALLRQSTLLAIESLGLNPSKADQESIAWRIFREGGRYDRPTSNTINEWRKVWLAAFRNIAALLPGNRLKGNYTSRSHPSAEAIGVKVIKKYFRSTRERSEENVYRYHYLRVHKREQRRGTIAASVPPMSPKAFFKLIDKEDPEGVLRDRRGQNEARKVFGVTSPRPPVLRALQEVQIDWSPIGLNFQCPLSHMKLKSALLCTAADVATGYLVGASITFGGESLLSLLQCIQHAIMDKSYVQRDYAGKVLGTWHAHGCPDLISIDNTAAAHAGALKPIMHRLGTSVRLVGRKCPTHKSIVEVMHKIFQEGLFSELPVIGKTLEQRSQHYREGHAISPETFKEVLHIFLIDIFAKGITQRFPRNRERDFLESISVHGVRPPVDLMAVKLLPTIREKKSLKGSTIQNAYLKYGDDTLKLVKAAPLVIANDMWVEAAINPFNLHSMEIMNPGVGWVTIPCTQPHLISGTTVAQHNCVIRVVKEILKTTPNEDSIQAARELIVEILEGHSDLPKRDMLRFQKIMVHGEQPYSISPNNPMDDHQDFAAVPAPLPAPLSKGRSLPFVVPRDWSIRR